ncbi:lysosome membrane protein 2 [Hyperolius riggenbachi]|uniref:lysosome membrane protein 2 n=1 Tax=Hyperolius riggenbachi TaxID=752182 RepID=UPI0035A2D13A
MGRCTVYVCGITSLVLLIASIVLLVAHTFMDMVETKVKQETVLKNTSEAFKDWANPPPPIYMKFYFFDVVNPQEVLNGEKPFVHELGPYVYREYRPKENIEFLENGTEVSAINPKTYVFEPELSKGDPKIDKVRTVNIPVVTLLEMVKNLEYVKFIAPIVKAALVTYGEGMFVTRTVHELLWGYKDPILSMVHTVQPNISDTVGLFYNMNTTNDGTYVFLSGAENYLDFSRIVEWNGKRNLTWWTSETSNMINGTDGTSFHPLISKDDVLYMFSSDLCRSLYAVYESTKDVKGIPTFRFVPPAKVFANASINPDNAGFCVPKGNCLPSGLVNVSQCKQGAPIILSPPHFYQAEESVIDSIEGMHPKKEDHETFLDINPLTGLLLRVAKRMQVNVYVTQVPEFSGVTQKIQTLYFPVMHLSEEVLVDDDSTKRIQTILLAARTVANIPFMIMAVGILFGVVFVIFVCRTNRTREEGNIGEHEPLIRA